ncbi:MAG: hypothetical protein WBG34_09325 [Flavobacteriales bacterium]
MFRAGTFADMCRFLSRLDQAWLLLAVMLFMAMPRTAFHHCEEGALLFAAHEASPVVHVDIHCPLCEAPLPIFDGVPEQALKIGMVYLGDPDTLPVPSAFLEPIAVPRLRGPPGEA